MTATKVLETKRAEIADLCLRYGVERLLLFGSALRSDWDPQTSDFDFVAEFGAPPAGVSLLDQHFGFEADLQQLLGRRVDVVEAKMLKWVIRDRVLEEARLIYAA
ncbi:MAG: nucleotidyltransferase domain-containing protein [Armatimonadota bacterium]